MDDLNAMIIYFNALIGESMAKLRSILTPLHNSIMNMVNSGMGMSSLIERVGLLLQNKGLLSPAASGNMAVYLANIESAAAAGIRAPGTGGLLGAESRAAVLNMVKQSAFDQITNLSASMRKDIGNTLKNAVSQGQSPQQISATLQQQFKLQKYRADAIARTETMRAGNMARHATALQNGMKYFIVIPRGAACKYCYTKYEGEIFDITDTINVPPLHVNCLCITRYYDTLDAAGKGASQVMNNNEFSRANMIKQGETINTNGMVTKSNQYDIGRFDGPTLRFKNYNDALRYVKKNPTKIRYATPVDVLPKSAQRGAYKFSKDKIDRYGALTIPRGKVYAKEKLLYKKVRMPIMQARHNLQRPQIKQTIKDIKDGKAVQFNRNKTKIPSNERKVYDLHIHTDASIDGKQTLEDAVKRAKKLGLDGIAITDHNTMKNAQRWKEFSTSKFKVIPGMEITTTKGHMIALGIQKPIRPMMSPRATLQAIKEQGGVAILPHSMAKYRDGIAYNIKRSSSLDLKVDNIEIVNSRYGQGATNFKSRELAEAKRISGVAGSDAHTSDGIGMALTEARSKTNSIDEVLNSIRLGRTNAYDSQIALNKLRLTPIKWPKGTEIEPKKYPIAKEWN